MAIRDYGNQPGRRQVGGDHYVKRTIQPWDVIKEYGLDFFTGNALKYLMRHEDKGGLEDLKKARHYLDEKIAQLEAVQLRPVKIAEHVTVRREDIELT